MKHRGHYWLSRIFKYAFIIIVLFLAYAAILLAGYGIQPWDKFFATGGALLLSIVSMYFGYKIERYRHRRESEVEPFIKFMGDVGDLMEQVRRISHLPESDKRKKWSNIKQRSDVLLLALPSPTRLSRVEFVESLEVPYRHIEAILALLSQTSISEIEPESDFFQQVYNDMKKHISLVKRTLIEYEQLQ